MKRLDLSTKKQFSTILEFPILRGRKGGKSLKFRKIQTFEQNSAPNYFSVRNCNMSGLDLNAKKHFWRFWNFRFKGRKITKFQKKKNSHEQNRLEY